MRKDAIIINALGEELHFAKRSFRNNPVDDPVEAGFPFKIFWIRFDHDLFIRHPLHKAKRARPHGFTVK